MQKSKWIRRQLLHFSFMLLFMCNKSHNQSELFDQGSNQNIKKLIYFIYEQTHKQAFFFFNLFYQSNKRRMGRKNQINMPYKKICKIPPTSPEIANFVK